jgi:hypothetical protein
MPAIAWRWSDQVAGARLVLDGYADALYESPETGKSKLIKAQLQVWLPGELAPLPAPRRFVRFQRIGEAPEACAVGLQVIGSCMRRPAQLLRPAVPALAPGRVYSAVRNLIEVVPGAFRELFACDKLILEARSTAQDYLSEDGLNSYIERNCQL